MGRLIDADVLIEKLKIIREAELQIYGIGHWNFVGKCINEIEEMPSAQPEPYIDSIVSEVEKTISETRENGKHHDINVRTNGAMICFGLQLALEIIEEKRNERHDI